MTRSGSPDSASHAGFWPVVTVIVAAEPQTPSRGQTTPPLNRSDSTGWMDGWACVCDARQPHPPAASGVLLGAGQISVLLPRGTMWFVMKHRDGDWFECCDVVCGLFRKCCVNKVTCCWCWCSTAGKTDLFLILKINRMLYFVSICSELNCSRSSAC